MLIPVHMLRPGVGDGVYVNSGTHAPSWSGGRGYMLIPVHMLRPGVGDGGIC